MPDTAVASDAVGTFAPGIIHHPADDFPVTPLAIVHGDFPVQRLDLYRFVKTAGGKCRTVFVPVEPLNHIFTDSIFRGMAAVAGCCLLVAGTVPGIVLFTHNMAVAAGFRIIMEIGGTIGIEECKSGKSQKDAKSRRYYPFWK